MGSSRGIEEAFLMKSTDYYGLKSPGLTCYLNSVLQVLFMTDGFCDAVERFVTSAQISWIYGDIRNQVFFCMCVAGLNTVLACLLSPICALAAAVERLQASTDISISCLLICVKARPRRTTS